MLITNENAANTVKNVADNILPDCDEVFFEVGYFYFSNNSVSAAVATTSPATAPIVTATIA